jgi:hypothetical protein
MSSVTPQDSTVVAIRKKVRRLTASSSEAELTTADLDEYINTFYNSDFPYGIKIDQMRSVYTFFTRPYIDRYPVDVNYNQGIRAPVYVEGIQGSFYKDRQQFYALWPRFPTKFQPASGDGSTVDFSFTLPGPFLSREVVIGGVAENGTAITINDNGNGRLYLLNPNSTTYVPAQDTNPAVQGMYNLNTGGPGLNNPTDIGSVDYVTGSIAFSLPSDLPPASGTVLTAWVSQYQTGRPYSLLFWNNEFTIRPVPKLVHKVEVECFLTPVQFMLTTDSPILNQWWQYIAIGASMKILEDRQDMEGVANLQPIFKKQEALVLERQGIEELFTPNPTLFNSVTPVVGGLNGIGYY